VLLLLAAFCVSIPVEIVQETAASRRVCSTPGAALANQSVALQYVTHAVMQVAAGAKIGADILFKGSYVYDTGRYQLALFDSKMTSSTKGSLTGTIPVSFPAGA